MAINDFVRRSIQIVGGGIAQSTTDYFDNAVSFTNDVKEVIDMGKQMGSDGAKKFNELKSSGILKKTRDWFYNEGGMFGDFDFDDDDFDAGFEIDSADSETSTDSSKPLSKDMMTDIAKKQTGAMYKAFGRQADLHIANTAEIISTINTRTAELTASVNNVNNTLIQIGKRLDLIVEWTSARTKKEEEEKRVAGILDYGGGISLSGVVNKAKENAEDSMLGTFMSIGKTMLGSGMMTPETVMSMILSQTILDKKWDKLGGKSINDIGEFINDTVGEVIQNTMTKVLTSKNEILESLFDDIITKAGRKNYQNSVKNTYNDKPAVFDGMTRKSIISVIPGYLNEILKAVSKDGVGREIDSKGNLTKKKTNSFVKEVADSYFRYGTMEWKQREAAAERTGLTREEVANAVRTLTGCWIWYMYRSGRVILEIGEVKNIEAPSTRNVVNNAAYMMASADPEHRSEDEWKELYQGIIEQIDEFKYRQELQRSAERADKNLETFAKSHVNNHQAKTVDESVILQAFRHNYSEANKDAKFRNPSEPESTGASPTAIGSRTNLLSVTELDYMAGIFDRLNRGLNVFITGQSDNKKKKYNKINMIPGYAARKIRGSGTSAADDSDEGGITPVVNRLKDALSQSDKKKEKMDDATKEAYEAKERGEELSKEQEKLLKEYEKQEKKGVVGWIRNKLNKHAERSQREGIVSDPELYDDISKAVDGVKNFFKDLMPESLKGVTEKIKGSQLYQDITESDTAKKVKKKATKAKERAVDTLLGEKRTDEEGNEFRAEGLVQRAYAGTGKAASGIGDFINRHTPTKILENRTKKLIEEYGPDKEFDEDDSDARHMQVITGMINIAMSNGDFSTFDQQVFNKEINAIKSQDLKRRLRQSVIPLMKKNTTTSDENEKGGKVEPTSTLGKLGKLIFGSIKLVIGPIIGYVKVVIGSVFFIIKKGMGTLLKFAMKGIRSGLIDLRSGFKSVVSGVKKMFKPVGKLVKGTINVAYKAGKKMTEIGSSVFKYVKKGFTNIFSGIGNLFGRDKNKPQSDPSQQSGIQKFLSGIGDKFAKSSFGKGFMKALNDRKEAQAQAKLKEQSAPVVEGIDTSETGKDIQEILESEDGKKGVFKRLITLVQGIFDKVPDQTEEEEENPEIGGAFDNDSDQNEEEENNSETGENENTGTGNNQQTEENNNTAENTQTEQTGQTEQQSTTPAPTLAAPEGGESSGEGGGSRGFMGRLKGGVKGVLAGIGEALGGTVNIGKAILKIVLSFVMTLEGLKALVKLVTTILIESLQPLNEAFQAITKALKPMFKQLGGLIKQLSEFIVVIVDTVVDFIKPILTDVIQPVLEVLSPLLEAILGALTPLLKLVGIILKSILAPFMGIFKFVVVPILKIIGDAVQIIMGVLQIGFGLLMCLGGTIISVLGAVISAIPGAGGKGKGIKDSGKNMTSQGENFIASGVKSVGQGAINLALDVASLLTLGDTDELLGRNEDEEKPKETKKIEAPEGNAVEETFANGDVTNIYNTYGGEYQRGMGGYLNMNQRGCGPIALADMYNRNNEGRISARALAGSMFGSGRYDPHRGTSVGDYIDTAHSMGMNLTPGKVTQQTLKSASPTHPITVVGSGSDYGTRRGNNHFMNVIGTDSHGTAFVSNPLTGRIDRKPASTIAGSAVVGLYGSGDEADGGYTFPQAIKDAFQKLKAEAAKILGLFTMEKSDEEETEDLINEEQNKNATEQAKRQLQANNSELYEKYEEQAKIDARTAYEEKYPQRDNQSDEEYEKGFEDFWNKTSVQYLARAVVEDKTMSEAAKEDFDEKSGYREIATVSDKFATDMAAAFEDVGSAADTAESSFASSGGGGSGYFTSDEGVPLWVPYGDNIQITETDITKGPANAPLFEFFAKTMGLNLGDIYGSSWFTYRNNPDKEGVGSSGGTHGGVDFTGGAIHGKPLYATTGGKVVANWTPGESSGGGNTVVWEDSAGKYHWYMHMNERSTLNVGDTIEGGDLIGYVGSTGQSTGDHLHYTINNTLEKSGIGAVNPLMYFKNYNPTGGEAGVALGDTDEEKVYSYLTTAGMTPIGASGLMGCFKYESDMKTNNLENSYNDQFGLSDSEYTAAVDSGKETEKQFVTGRNATAWAGQTPGEAVGYGIAQFTSSNLKQDLYNKTVKQGGSIAKLEPQLDAIISVLKERHIYDTINNAKTPTDANKTFLWKYEAGTGYTSDAAVLADYPWMRTSNPDGTVLRHQYAEQVYNTYKDWKPQGATHSFSDSNGNIKTDSAGDAKMNKNLQTTGSTSGKGTGIVVTKNDQLNVRKDKSINSDIIGHLDKGDQIDIEECNSNEWLYVPSMDGYVSADFIDVLTSDAQSNNYAIESAGGNSSNKIMNTTGYVNEEYAKYLNAYAKTARLGAPNVKTSDVVRDFQNYLINYEGMTSMDILNAGNRLYKGSWKSGDYPKLWLWARENYGKQGNNNNLVNTTYDNNSTTGNTINFRTTSDVIEYNNSAANDMIKNKIMNAAAAAMEYDTPSSGVQKVGETLYDIYDAFAPGGGSHGGGGRHRGPADAKSGLIANIKNLPSLLFSKGSGDADTILAEDQFWNTYLGLSNSSANVTPGLSDGSDTAYSTDTYYDPETGTTVVNNYTVTRAEDKATDARLKAILANTYNVRSESMEALLEAILEELKKRRDPNGGGNNTKGSQKLFDERIPSQVTKLSIG